MPSTSWPGETASRLGGSPPRSTAAGTSSRGAATGSSASSRRRTTPRSSRRCSATAEELGPRARARAAGRPDGLHDQRRVRPADRGLRPASDDPRAVASALLPGAARGARLRQDDGPPDVVPGDGRAEGGRRLCRRDPRGRRQGRVRARDHGPEHEQARPRGRDRSLHGGLQLGLGEELGLRADHGGGGRLPGEEPEADPRPALGLHGGARRRGPRGRPDASRHQPGDQEDERSPAALRLAALPARQAARSTACGSSLSG